MKKKKKNKNKKGFTLVELLGVVLVLGVVSLVAVPVVNNVIEKSKEGAAESSTKEYLKSVDQKITTSQFDEENIIEDGTYNISSLNDMDLDIQGTTPKSGYVQIEDGKVASSTVFIDGYSIFYENDTYTIVKGYIFQNGTPIYFNPETGALCKSSEVISTSGTKNGCMKWYIFNDEENNESVNLILDHNTTGAMYWNNTSDFITGPSEAYEQLKSDTSSWNDMLLRSDKYNYTNDSGASYTINYEGMKARFITANEIAKIVGLESWNEKTSKLTDWFYLDSKEQTGQKFGKGTSDYAWLYDHIYNCISYGCNYNETTRYYGYWTASAVNGQTNNVWRITTTGRLYDDNAKPTVVTGRAGIRPVITIDRSILLN